jgi:hypothetical protein
MCSSVECEQFDIGKKPGKIERNQITLSFGYTGL